MKPYLFFLLFISCFFSEAQEVVSDSISSDRSTVVDERYREDQFYLGVTFNLVLNTPDRISQRGFSGGLHAGFIRDFPINKSRRRAIGIGLGYAYDRYDTTLFIGEDANENTIFSSLAETSFSKNRLYTHTVEMPIQYRWRSSTSTSYEFWRIYVGGAIGYTYHYLARFEQTGNRVGQVDIPEFNTIRGTAWLTFGYSQINFTIQYQFTPLFNGDAMLDGNVIDINPLRFGIQFYLL